MWETLEQHVRLHFSNHQMREYVLKNSPSSIVQKTYTHTYMYICVTFSTEKENNGSLSTMHVSVLIQNLYSEVQQLRSRPLVERDLLFP